jgi:hypothetical protein
VPEGRKGVKHGGEVRQGRSSEGEEEEFLTGKELIEKECSGERREEEFRVERKKIPGSRHITGDPFNQVPVT